MAARSEVKMWEAGEALPCPSCQSRRARAAAWTRCSSWWGSSTSTWSTARQTSSSAKRSPTSWSLRYRFKCLSIIQPELKVNNFWLRTPWCSPRRACQPGQKSSLLTLLSSSPSRPDNSSSIALHLAPAGLWRIVLNHFGVGTMIVQQSLMTSCLIELLFSQVNCLVTATARGRAERSWWWKRSQRWRPLNSN